MTDIQIKDIPGIKNVEFTFLTSLEININKPFADDLFDQKGAIPLKSFKAEASRSFPISSGNNKIDFDAGADAFSALGVFRKTDSLLESLKSEGMSEPIANLLNVQIADDENLIAIRWGYNLNAAVEGKVAIAANPINITLGADGSKSGLYTILHSRKRTEKVIDSLTETLKNWKIPRQIEQAKSLKPKTTIAMETFGNIKMSIGVQYGYNYNWMRDEVKIGNLSGEFGAKINAAIDAKFGFEASGRYAIVISRETDAEKLRVQVFKLKQNGMSFAFNGGVSGQFFSPDLPKKLEPFIKSVFNLNGSQVLKDFEKWANTDNKIEDLLGTELEVQAKRLLKSVTGIDPGVALEDSVKKLKDLINTWHELPSKINTLIYDLLPEDLTKFKDFLNKVVGFAGNSAEVSEKIAAEIEKNLENVDFFATPIGKWINEIANGEITSLLANFDSKQKKEFLDLSKQTLALLDSGDVEERLRNLQKYIDEKLNLDKIDELANIDEWLKQRLITFLGKQKTINKDLEEIREAIKNLRANADKIYQKGYAALTKKYGAEISYKFQKSTSNDALIDIAFDFENGNYESSAKYLKNALNGDFTDLLSKQIDGITLKSAVLSHGINRSSHLEITLPFSHSVITHINKSKADGKLIDEVDGRLWLYTLESKDILRKGDKLSQLAVTAEFLQDFDKDVDIRQFEKESFTINHDFLYANRVTERLALEKRFELAIREYFSHDIPSFSNYLTSIDAAMTKNNASGTNKIGSAMVSLDLGLDGRTLSAWKNLPRNYNDDKYKEISAIIQKRLREWIPFVYIQDTEKYEDTDAIYPLLVYKLLPPFTELVKDRFMDGIRTNVYHWDYFEKSNKARAFDTFVQDRITNQINQIIEIVNLSDLKDSTKTKIVKKYRGDSATEVRKKGIGEKLNVLGKLERKVIEQIIEIAREFHAFLDEPDKEKKLKALAQFGSTFTKTFNDRLGHIFYTPSGSLRPLGLILISDIAKVLDPDLSDVKLSAILDVYVLNASTSKDDFNQMKDKFLNNEYPFTEDTKGLIAIHNRVINKETKLLT